jgi:glyoxylase-like metal-dependent hydrolase (beta-lactamase superfamily II)
VTAETQRQQESDRTIYARLRSLAESLDPGQAVIVGDLLFARTWDGNLRLAGWDGWLAMWVQAPFEQALRSELDMLLDWTQRGHFASRSKRNIDSDLASPHVLSIKGVGRVRPRLFALSALCDHRDSTAGDVRNSKP